MLSHARLAAPAALKAGVGLGSRRRQTARATQHRDDAVPGSLDRGGPARVMDSGVSAVIIQTLYHQSHACDAGDLISAVPSRRALS